MSECVCILTESMCLTQLGFTLTLINLQGCDFEGQSDVAWGK